MEKILRQILQEELGPFKKEFNEVHKRLGNVEVMLSEHGKSMGTLEVMAREHGKRMGTLEVMAREHGKRMGTLEVMTREHGKRMGTLEMMVSGMKDEHGRMLGAIIESKDIQRGEIDNLRYQSALLEGTMKRSANQVLDDLKKAK